jgi:hypothetical protein
MKLEYAKFAELVIGYKPSSLRQLLIFERADGSAHLNHNSRYSMRQ